MNQQRVEEIIAQFSAKKILVVGDVVIDQYVYGIVERLNPEAPVPILNVTREEERTGGAGNTAKNVASLGAAATLVSVVGEDEAAARLVTTAQAEGYTAKFVADVDRPTIRKLRYLVGSQQMLRVDYERADDVTAAVEKELLAALHDAAADVDAIIVSDYAKGVITPAIAAALLALKKDRAVLLAADVKPSRAKHFIGSSFIAPNFKEAHEFLGLNMHEKKETKEFLAEALRKKMKSDVFLTLSADGMYVQADTVTHHVPQQFVPEVADPSGAGDTATVVLTLALLAGATPVEAAQLANAAGAVVVSKIGSAAVTPSELADMMQLHYAP